MTYKTGLKYAVMVLVPCVVNGVILFLLTWMQQTASVGILMIARKFLKVRIGVGDSLLAPFPYAYDYAHLVGLYFTNIFT